MCRILALKTGAKVISVDYRLAPEHAEELNGDPNNLIVGGDSAGAPL